MKILKEQVRSTMDRDTMDPHWQTEFILSLNRCPIQNTSNAKNVLGTKILSLNKKCLKNVATFLGDKILRLKFIPKILNSTMLH